MMDREQVGRILKDARVGSCLHIKHIWKHSGGEQTHFYEARVQSKIYREDGLLASITFEDCRHLHIANVSEWEQGIGWYFDEGSIKRMILEVSVI